MHDVKVCRQWICRCVRRAQHAVLNGRARQGCAQLHPDPRLQLIRLGHDFRKSGEAKRECFTRKFLRKLVALGRHRRFHGMGNRVNSSASGHTARLREGEDRIKNRDARGALRVEASHLLMGQIVGNPARRIAVRCRCRRWWEWR